MYFRFEQAWITCEKINEKESWLKLGENAIANLNIDFGIRFFLLLLLLPLYIQIYKLYTYLISKSFLS